MGFDDDRQIDKVNADFREDAGTNEVRGFTAEKAMEWAGEIIVSVDHARSRAEELGEPFSRELSLYLIHGWLHLAGYDDRTEVDRAKMREAEQLALSLLDTEIEPIEFQLS